MLYLLNIKKNPRSFTYLGDKLNIFYRFKGVFFLFTGFCTLKKKKTLSLYEKKKQHFVFFLISRFNIHKTNVIHSYLQDNIRYKLLNKTKNHK